jgi:DNA mismatch repair protein MutL
LGTLRTKFLTSDLTARGVAPSGQRSVSEYETEAAVEGRSQLVEWAKEQLGRQLHEPAGQTPAGELESSDQPLRMHRFDVAEFKPFDMGRSAFAERDTHAATRGQNLDRRSDADSPDASFDERRNNDSRHALQVHNRYLVVETSVGIEVIDQHALHERILYEQLRVRVLGGTIESQKLLVPEPVDLSAAEAAAVLEQAELLAQLGVEVQPFGGDTVLVASYPAMLANMSPAEVLRELVERLLAGSRAPEPRDLLDDLLHMIACKAAVKFGDRLSAEEIDSLLAQRHLAQDTHHCPHGRPTALVFTREELDRQFQRI